MENNVKELAKIKSASLNIKDRGILTFWLEVDYENGFSQMIGGLALDKHIDGYNDRVGTAYGCEMIRRMLVLLNVGDFSEMVGKYIWVIGEGDGCTFDVKGISALKVDGGKKDLIFKDVLEETKNWN